MGEQPDTDLPKRIGAPATRALIAAGFTRVEQLANVLVSELKQLHGMRPKALSHLQEVLDAKGAGPGLERSMSGIKTRRWSGVQCDGSGADWDAAR